MRVFLIFITAITFFGCKSNKEIDATWARERNIGSKLQGKTVVYTFFIDTKTSLDWSGFDILSTKDSLQKVYDFVSTQSKNYGQSLNIIPIYYEEGKKQTLNKKLPYDNLSTAIGSVGDADKLDKWAESIVKKAVKSIKLPEGVEVPKKPRLSPFEELVFRLKSVHNADNVAVLFMLNNYFIIDASLLLNTMQDSKTEFAINSGKNTNTLAMQFLSLFGAQLLSGDGYGSYHVKDIKIAEEAFPNDVMLDYTRDLSVLSIDEYTAYLIGWVDKLDFKYVDLIKIQKSKKKKK